MFRLPTTPAPGARSSCARSLAFPPAWSAKTSGIALVLLCLLGGSDNARIRGDAKGSEARTESEDREHQVKAAFLLNFIRYTTWPKASFEKDSDPIRLTVVGRDPFGSILESTFREEKANGRRIEVVRSKGLPEDLGHVVFCGELSSEERQTLLARCARRPILLVGEIQDFALDGACINFFLSDNKVRFEANTEALAEASLELSASVLKLAKIVKTRRGN